VARSFSKSWIAALAMMIIPGVVSLIYLKSAPEKPVDSIAVLPFRGEPSLSEPLMRDIISELTRVPGLSIPAPELVGKYASQEWEPRAVSSELQVRAILHGKIERTPGGVAIGLELNGADGRILWTEHYERADGNLSALAARIARDLQSHLSSR